MLKRSSDFADWYYHRHDGDWGQCNSPDVPVDPPHVLTMVGLILIFVGGLIGFGLLIDVAPATAIKTWMMWSGGVGVVLGMALTAVSIYLDERRTPPVPPSAPE